MIPKIIHYCWLSSDPYPESIQKCIDSWKRYLPDYKLMLWNFDRFPQGKSKWVDQAFDTHNYAFAADYIRLYALYNYGGIYLDSDVEVVKPFDDLLKLPYFIGQENTPSGIEAATLGFEKGNLLVKDLMDYYQDRTFINENGSFEKEPLPYIIRKCIEANYTYNTIQNIDDFIHDDGIVNVLPVDWFSPKHWRTKETKVTTNTHSIHHFAGSWLDHQNECRLPSDIVEFRKRKALLYDKMIKKIKKWCKHKALNDSAMAAICFRLINKDRFYFADSRLFVFSADYIKIANLRRPLSRCQYEFIRKEESKYNQQIHSFYPIVRVCGTDIEIHTKDIREYAYSKTEILSILKSL